MRIAIIGGGGHAKVVADAILAAGRYQIFGFFDDDASLWRSEILGFPIVGPVENWRSHSMDAFVIGIGDNANRKKMFDQLKSGGATLATVTHPRAILGKGVVLGEGTVVLANVVVNADTTIGPDSILNTSCTVDHDCIVGAHTHLAPGVNVAGEVRIGEGVFAGTGAKIIPRARIGDRAIIGAGAVVIRDVKDAVTVVGVPARTI
jgi:sugar O-acyltransferase (sialic acid O-acetyltransferase NeuD family)